MKAKLLKNLRGTTRIVLKRGIYYLQEYGRNEDNDLVWDDTVASKDFRIVLNARHRIIENKFIELYPFKIIC